MTVKETAKLLAMIKAYNYKFDGDAQVTTNAWHHILKDYDYDIAELAVINFVKTDRGAYIKFPKPGDIIEQIDLLTVKENPIDDLWQALSKAVKNCYPEPRKAFEGMPEECQKWVGSVQDLKNFANMQGDTFATVTRGQFYKQMPEVLKRKKAQAEIPTEIKEKLNGILQIGETNG